MVFDVVGYTKRILLTVVSSHSPVVHFPTLGAAANSVTDPHGRLTIFVFYLCCFLIDNYQKNGRVRTPMD